MSHHPQVVLKEVVIINETLISIEGENYKKHDPFGKELKIIEDLVRIVDKLTPVPPANDNIITSLRVTKISINNLIIQGDNIMVATISKTQKVVQTVTGLNAALLPVPLGHLAGLTAVIDNPAVAAVGPIDTVNQTVTVLGVSDGSYNITYTGTNDLGATVTFTEPGTVADADNVITSLSTTSGTPAAQ
jgi:hypothetical protein